jgi:hypothetical protein
MVPPLKWNRPEPMPTEWSLALRALTDRLHRAAAETGLTDADYMVKVERNKAGNLVVAIIISPPRVPASLRRTRSGSRELGQLSRERRDGRPLARSGS